MAKEFYIGFTKDGKERLFLKKYDDCRGTTYSYFQDLETNEIFYYGEIDGETLKPVDEILKNLKRKTKRKVKKAYKIDRNELIKIDYLVASDIYENKMLAGIWNYLKINEELFEHLIERDVLFTTDCSNTKVKRISNGDMVFPFTPWPCNGFFI